MGIDILFGTVEIKERAKDGATKISTVRRRSGAVFTKSTKYIDISKPKTRSEILASFIELIDAVDTEYSPIEFRLRYNHQKAEYVVEREWTEK